MIKTRNRYVIASVGITLHLMIGGVYAWSVFTGPIVKQPVGQKPPFLLPLV